MRYWRSTSLRASTCKVFPPGESETLPVMGSAFPPLSFQGLSGSSDSPVPPTCIVKVPSRLPDVLAGSISVPTPFPSASAP